MAKSRVPSLCLMAVVALTSAGPCAADPPPPEITIKIKRSPSYRLDIGQRGVGICKNGDEDCASSLMWRVGKGSNGPKENEQIRITYKPSPCGSEACFAEARYLLSKANPRVDSGPVSESCPTPTAWFYSAELLVDGQVVFSVDPGVIIDRGRLR